MFFTDNLHLIKPDGQLFWIDWMRNSANDDVHLRLHPGTVMMAKDSQFRYPETGPRARMGEDLDFAADLCREVPVAMLGGMGWLYLYIFHGANTFSKAHHYSIAACRSVPNEWVMARSAEIRRAMRYYQATTPVIVCGAQGPVFALP